MPIIAARRYSSAGLAAQELVVDGNPCSERASGEFDWIGLAEPGADELALVQRQFGLHSLAIEDAFNAQQLPKVEVYDDQLFIVARTAHLEGEAISYGETAIFLSKGFIITVRHGSARAHSNLRRQLESTPGRLSEGVDYVLHAILDFIVDGYFPIIEKIEEQVDAIEDRALDAFPDPEEIRRIFRLRRQLTKFQRILGPMEEVALKLSTVELPAVDKPIRHFLRDVLDHVRRVSHRAQALRETLASVVDTSSLLEQHRVGKMTRQLAAWAAILAVPTAIAGIYGMNFDVMPELRWRYGYPMVVSVILLICGGLWLRFRRIGWL